MNIGGVDALRRLFFEIVDALLIKRASGTTISFDRLKQTPRRRPQLHVRCVVMYGAGFGALAFRWAAAGDYREATPDLFRKVLE